MSSDTTVVRVSVTGSTLGFEPVSAGQAEATVTVANEKGRVVTQTLMAQVADAEVAKPPPMPTTPPQPSQRAPTVPREPTPHQNCRASDL